MRFRPETVLLAGLLGCGARDKSEKSPTLDTWGTDTGVLEDTTELNDPYIEGRHCPEDSILTWTNFGLGFMLTNCVGCHSSLLDKDSRSGAPEGADFETQGQVQQWLVSIYQFGGDDNTVMPPTDSVSSEDRMLFGEWLSCGAP